MLRGGWVWGLWRYGEADDGADVHGVDDVVQELLEEKESVAAAEQKRAEVVSVCPPHSRLSQ